MAIPGITQLKLIVPEILRVHQINKNKTLHFYIYKYSVNVYVTKLFMNFFMSISEESKMVQLKKWIRHAALSAGELIPQVTPRGSSCYYI